MEDHIGHSMLRDTLQTARRGRLPFTGMMLLLIGAAGLASNTFARIIEADVLERFGLAPADFAAWELWRAFTSVFLTEGGLAFWTALALVAIVVGAFEARFGTPRAALVFWGAHLATVAAMFAIALPVSAAGVQLGSLVYLVRDVGPSAGYVGVLAALLVTLPDRWRRWLTAAVVLVLIGSLGRSLAAEPLVPVAVSADMSHLVAFALASAAAWVFHARAGSERLALNAERS